MNRKEYRKKQRELKKYIKKNSRLTRFLSFITGLLFFILLIGTIVLNIFDNPVTAFSGDSFWQLENSDSSAQYYKSDFNNRQEMIDYGDDVVLRVEQEGATLLLNNNNALPLSKQSKVSLFSTSSVNMVYGGTGSGYIDTQQTDNLKDSLEDASLVVNPTLWDFYLKGEGSKYFRPDGFMVAVESAKVSEAPWSAYTDDVVDSINDYNDAAIVVLSRVGGEGCDLDFKDVNYLALDENEIDMFENIYRLKINNIIKKVIVIINSANPLQMDFIKDNPYGIDACLWVGDIGNTGITAIGQILVGDVNPSGSLVDTYCYDNYSSPAMQNNTPITYFGYNGKNISSSASTYMIYQEGIYIGYKYYETRYEDYVLGVNNVGDYIYNDVVAYPFGYGLSYSLFEYSDFIVEYNSITDKFEISITVKNIGKVAGKETVQIYGQSPYTQYDIENGIEKSSVQLVGFNKTDLLEPNQSQTLTIKVDKKELASYDSYNKKTYILEDGTYYLTAATSSHDAINNILATKGKTVENTFNRMDSNGNKNLVYTYYQDTFDDQTYSISHTGTKITNQLDNGDINLYEGIKEHQSIKYLTRSNWVGTFPNRDNPLVLELTSQMIKDLQDIRYDASDYEQQTMPVMGQDGDLKLYDLMGKGFDDPLWQDLLNQISFDEMVQFLGDAFHWTMPIKSIEAPGSRNENGPQGLTASLFGNNDRTKLEATPLTSEDVMAATFNISLMEEIGIVIANNCIMSNVNILYGPGNNMHRTPFGGRNFEYYSEDSFLSGMMSAYEVKAIQDRGVHVVMKHFALNDSEQDRIGLGVWLNEQTAREIYLKAFELPFKYGNANGVMTAYTRFGCIWSGGHKGLMTNILRNEWGAKGLSITDNVLTKYTNPVDALLAGTSIFDAMIPFMVTEQLKQYENDPVIVNAMKEATHRNLYTIVNSCAMNGVGENTTIRILTPPLTVVALTCTVVSSILYLSILAFHFKAKYLLKDTDEYCQYIEQIKKYKMYLKTKGD